MSTFSIKNKSSRLRKIITSWKLILRIYNLAGKFQMGLKQISR